MPIIQNNVPLLHKKEWQNMGVLPAATAAGHFFVADDSGIDNTALLVQSATVQYIYNHDEDGFVQITSGALAGTFGAGACGQYHPWSITYTANGGSTTTITVPAATHNFTGSVVGAKVEFTSGANIGIRRKIIRLINDGGAGTITLTFDQAVTAVSNGDTFRLNTGKFFVLNAYTSLAAGVWKVFDNATLTWQSSLATSGLPASWGTAGTCVLAYGRDIIKVDSTVSSVSGAVITDYEQSWDTDEFKKHIVRITGGTGLGQVRYITGNTEQTFTVNTAFSPQLDSTSTYVIEGGEIYSTGLATSGGATTITDTGKAWGTNQWTNYQVRIVGGTGIGQTRVIASNTATALTVSAWTTQPDNTSYYVIEGNEDKIYLLGNGAVTMYAYTISSNTWATVSPSVARVGAPTTVMMAEWIGTTGVEGWADETAIMDGKYIYSPRGAATATLTRYNIATNAWGTVTYAGAETFTTGSSSQSNGRYLYIIQNSTGRVFKYSARGNYLEPVTKTDYTQSTAVIGDKMWIKKYDSRGKITWLYNVLNTSTVMQRVQLY